MRLSKWIVGALCASALAGAGRAPAATVTHSTVADFMKGVTTGAASAISAARTVGAPGGAGIVMQPGTSTLNENFDYANVGAATSAGWQLMLPNSPDPNPNPSSFSFPGNGALRFHMWKQQDFWNTGGEPMNHPLLAINNKPLTGDFVVETKFTVQSPRQNDLRLQGGIIVALPDPGSVEGGTPTVTVDNNMQYFAAAAQQAGDMITFARWYPQDYPWPTALDTDGYVGNTVTIRVVRSGPYLFSFFKTSDDGPWIESQGFNVATLKADPNQPVLVGLVAKAWGGGTAYQDTDFDYFKINELPASQSGTFSNVMDAGVPSNWQSLNLTTQNMTGLKFQVRGGNAASGGTLTDGGDFVGPDNTSSSFYEGDVANILPASTQGKRYLEYKLSMQANNATVDHANVINLPSVVMNIKAKYQPAPVGANILTNKADFGADTAAVAVQNGDGDLGLKRTVVFREDFDSAPGAIGDMALGDTDGWVFDSGTRSLDPSVVGNYSWNGNTGQASQVTDGTPASAGPAGWLRLETGWMQDIYFGAKGGGVRMFRNLNGLTDFEVETELNTETQNSRMSGLYIWMNDGNFIGVVASRRFADTREIGIEDDGTVGNAFLTPDMIYTDYGSNHLFLRITKKGQIVTLSYRDEKSPSWKVHRVYNLAGLAGGGADFTPVLAGLMTKSFDHGDRDTKFADYNYFQVSTLSDMGAKDLDFTLPSGAHPDSLITMADNGGSISYQVKDSGGVFVGPDGTAGSTFSADEPKFPAAISGSNVTVRATFSDTNPAGTPYLHAIGTQYAAGPLARDTNQGDFNAALVKSSVNVADRPGAVTPTLSIGSVAQDDFNTPPSDWLFSNNWTGKTTPSSTYQFVNGNAELSVATPTDTWAPGAATEKPRVFLYKSAPVSGNFQIDTKIDMPLGRDTNRHQGIGVIQALGGGAPPDANLDMTNVINFGPYTSEGVNYLAILHGDANVWGDGPHIAGYDGTTYYLRLIKVGRTFTGYAGTDGVNFSEVTSYTMSHDMPSVYVGFFSKAWGGSGLQVMDFDFFKFSTLVVQGTLESRALDLGATANGLTPLMTTDGNSPDVQVQWRAADTEAGLSSAVYTGPDGTSGSTYQGSYTGVITGAAGKRYFQYKAVLTAGTILNDIAVVGVDSATLPPSRGDVMSILKIAGGIESLSSGNKARYDVNGDNAVDLLDAAGLLRTLNGL